MTVTQSSLAVFWRGRWHRPTSANLWAVSVCVGPGLPAGPPLGLGHGRRHPLTREVLPFWGSALLGLALVDRCRVGSPTLRGRQRRAPCPAANLAGVRVAVGRKFLCSGGSVPVDPTARPRRPTGPLGLIH